MIVSTYVDSERTEWDAFVEASRNGTFLLHRGYMEYHRDRFSDHSLVFRDDSGRIVGLMPAHVRDECLHSHAGLTYGGFVFGPRGGVAVALTMMNATLDYLRERGIAELHYKTIPWIYHRQPAEDDRYALFRAGATLSRRDVLSVVASEERIAFQDRRRRGVRKALAAGVSVLESRDFAAFWPVLQQNLQSRFGTGPVHSLSEIDSLAATFPASIRLFLAQQLGQVIAGVVVYETPRVAHVQYISANDAGKSLHALDVVFDHLLNVVYEKKPYFDFGISNENAGLFLNEGLVEQKEGFGARCVVHDHYLLSLRGPRE